MVRDPEAAASAAVRPPCFYNPMPSEEVWPVPASSSHHDENSCLRWKSVRVAGFSASLLCLLWLGFSGRQSLTSGTWTAILGLNLSPTCLKDEELFAGLCYMKCSLLTAGKAQQRIGNTMCCSTDNDFLCTFLQNFQSNSPSMAIGGGAAINNSPHAPGVGGVCNGKQDTYQGLCYPSCASLTNGQSPHRVGNFACCHGSKLDCVSGHGTISTASSYGVSSIPSSESPIASYDELRGMDAACSEYEEKFNGMCFTKCGILTGGQKPLRTGPSSCCSCGKGPFSGLCCLLPTSSAAETSYNSALGDNDLPHPPGMRETCSREEEYFQGICYETCARLTAGEMPYRLSALSCCKYATADACNAASKASVASVAFDKGRGRSNGLPHPLYSLAEH